MTNFGLEEIPPGRKKIVQNLIRNPIKNDVNLEVADFLFHLQLKFFLFFKILVDILQFVILKSSKSSKVDFQSWFWKGLGRFQIDAFSSQSPLIG